MPDIQKFTLSKSNFERSLDQFNALLHEFNGSAFTDFDEGLIAKWESYKTTVREIAIGRLKSHEWETPDIGSGRILTALISAIEIRDNNNIHNNLVGWEARHNQNSATVDLREQVGNGKELQTFERILFDLFLEHAQHSISLEKIVDLIGRQYSLVAYIFFVLDADQYMPIAPRTFDRAFADLGYDLRLSGNCSWDNFSAYNDGIRSVQQAFIDWSGLTETRLVDAHSFLWMKARLPGKIEEQKRQGIRKPDDVRHKMIELGHGIVYRAASANGQTEERVVKNKELFGFPSREKLYDFLCELWADQGGRCNLTGLPMVLKVPKGEANEMIVSVDRIDSEAHYSPENLQLCCWFANRWKGNLANEKFLELLSLVQRGGEDPQETTDFCDGNGALLGSAIKNR